MSTSFTGKAAPQFNAVSDTGAKELLKALVAFLQPVIQGYSASPASTKANDKNYHTDTKLINGVEGKNLLSALTAFVEAAVLAPPEARKKQENLPDAVDNQEISEVMKAPEIPKEVPRSELETKTLSAARAHVFNKMPIRLLAFDETGSNIRLIERNEIFPFVRNIVFQKINMPEFQSAWAEAETLKDSEFACLSEKFRSNIMKELLEGVVDKSVDYAILSHTWMRDAPGEVTFQDWATRKYNSLGNAKIIKFCEVAAQNHNVTLGWIDTVCINKDSSSELDESIRSMYNWYRGASICITFLSETASIADAHLDSWFTRGWTLQELLAPTCSLFYNGNWDQLGSSSNVEIQSVIQNASGITSRELKLSWSGNVAQIPFSRRMQMACGRQVTREEDTTYSLMGILEVDISIAYGEGASRAFFRLVRELFNTKKNVIDLFNRSYNWGENLLPSSLESYRYRRANWDYSNGGTSLDKYLPLNPIIPTHLGLHVPLLLVPGLRSLNEDDEKYAPKGAFSGQIEATFFPENGVGSVKEYSFLFDSRLYSNTADLASLCATLSLTLPDGMKPIVMRGLVNFGRDGTHIQLPELCFALKLFWNGVQEGNFSPSGNVYINSGTSGAFRLKAKKGLKVLKTELEEHGMQLVSLYL